jgi:excisionase family DNA binding protein
MSAPTQQTFVQPLPSTLTARELAHHWRVDLDTVYRAARRGELPARKVGRQWRFDHAAVSVHIGAVKAA